MRMCCAPRARPISPGTSRKVSGKKTCYPTFSFDDAPRTLLSTAHPGCTIQGDQGSVVSFAGEWYFVPNSLSLLAAAAIVQLVLIAALVAQWRRGRNMHLLAQRRAGVDERAGALVHELNQPLTAILSNAQAAQRFLAA